MQHDLCFAVSSASCYSETTEDASRGTFNWPLTAAGKSVIIQCPYQLPGYTLAASRRWWVNVLVTMGFIKRSRSRFKRNFLTYPIDCLAKYKTRHVDFVSDNCWSLKHITCTHWDMCRVPTVKHKHTRVIDHIQMSNCRRTDHTFKHRHLLFCSYLITWYLWSVDCWLTAMENGRTRLPTTVRRTRPILNDYICWQNLT